MAFLSLANFLGDDVVRKIFRQDPMVENGLSLISEYQVNDAEKIRFKRYVDSLQLEKFKYESN